MKQTQIGGRNIIQINGLTIETDGLANVSVSNGNVVVNGKLIKGIKDCSNITIKGNIGPLKVTGNVEVEGNVDGDIDAGGSVSCGDVSGSIDAGGSVHAKNAKQNIDAGGSVHIG